MTSTPCKVAFIGAGSMAPEHLKAFLDVPGVELAGIYNRTRQKAEALADQFHIPHVCDSVAELYEKTQADLVVMAVYETAIKSVSLQVLDYPWTLLMEKPAGMDLSEGRELQAAAHAHQRRVFVGLNRRFISSTQAALEDLAVNSSPRYIYVQDQQSFETARVIGHDPAVVQRWMYANSIHLVDYLRTFGRGAVKAVTPVIPWRGEQTHMVVAKVEFESGDVGLYEGVWDGPGPWAVTVHTPERRWELRPLEQARYVNRGERRPNEVEMTDWDKAFKPGFRAQAAQAVAGALGMPSLCPTLDEALQTMGLIASIFTEA